MIIYYLYKYLKLRLAVHKKRTMDITEERSLTVISSVSYVYWRHHSEDEWEKALDICMKKYYYI